MEEKGGRDGGDYNVATIPLLWSSRSNIRQVSLGDVGM